MLPLNSCKRIDGEIQIERIQKGGIRNLQRLWQGLQSADTSQQGFEAKHSPLGFHCNFSDQRLSLITLQVGFSKLHSPEASQPQKALTKRYYKHSPNNHCVHNTMHPP